MKPEKVKGAEEMRSVVITAACRTPIGAFGGAFKNLGALDLTIPVMQELIKRSRLDAGRIDDVIWGCSESRTSGYSTGDHGSQKLYLLGVIGTVGILPDPGRRSRLYSGRRHRSDE